MPDIENDGAVRRVSGAKVIGESRHRVGLFGDTFAAILPYSAGKPLFLPAIRTEIRRNDNAAAILTLFDIARNLCR
jgi:hypothetical protein